MRSPEVSSHPEPLNSIKGFDKLEEAQDKVRRSVEKKINNRQAKIDKILEQFSSASSEELKELIQAQKKLGEVTKILAEQREISNVGSLGNVDAEAYTKKIEAVEKLNNLKFGKESIWWHRHLACAILNRLKSCSTIFGFALALAA